MPVKRKLSDEQVREIRRSEAPNTHLAAEYGVDRKVIQRIKRHDAYKDVRSLDESTVVVSAVGDEAIDRAVSAFPFPLPDEYVYVMEDGLTFLRTLDDAFFETIVTAPPCNLGTPPPRESLEREEYDARYQQYVDYHIDVISECFRVAGPSGVVFYIRPYQLDNGEMNTWHDLFATFPLRQVITWEHGHVARQTYRSPPTPELMHHLPRTSARIYMFAGAYWRVPDRFLQKDEQWGGVWHIKPHHGNLNQMPIKLAERCLALGRGRVLDPFAGTGNVGLAAIRQGRSCLLAGTEPDDQIRFAKRRLAFLKRYPRRAYRQIPGRGAHSIPR